MHKIATKIFIGSSLAFAFLGTLIVLFGSGHDDMGLTKAFMISILVILASFAVIVANLSVYAVHVAYKYLREDEKERS